MTDSDPSDSELYAVMVNQDLYHGSVWGSDAAHKGLKKHFSGRDAVRERVDAVPVEALEELVEQWDIENTDAFYEEQHAMGEDKKMEWANQLGQEQAFGQCAKELQEVIDSYE